MACACDAASNAAGRSHRAQPFARWALVATVAVAFLPRGDHAAVLADGLDSQVAELHRAVEEYWERIENLSTKLQTAAVAAKAGTGPAVPTLGGAVQQLAPAGQAPLPQSLEAVSELQAEFSALQQRAFTIGRESNDNAELARHPDVNDYVQSMREFKSKLASATDDLEREYKRAMGRKLEKPTKKRPKTIRGISEEDIQAKASAAVAQDKRDFRRQAMDLVSTFHERQLQMKDKQRELEVFMDGPDWPREDWPLTTADAKHVSEAEAMIQNSLQELNAKLEHLGGLGRVHESNDRPTLEKLAALNEMIVAYVELIDRHVSTVKRMKRAKKKSSGAKARSKGPTSGSGSPPTAAPPPIGGTVPLAGQSLRDRLLSFGGPQTGPEQPFAWLRGPRDFAAEASKIGAPAGDALFGSVDQSGVGSNLGTLGAAAAASGGSVGSGSAPLGTTYGTIGSFGVLGAASAGAAAGSGPGLASGAPTGLGSRGSAAFGATRPPLQQPQQIGRSSAMPAYSSPMSSGHSPEL